MMSNPNRRRGIGSLLARHWWTVALRGALPKRCGTHFAILFGLAVFM
ncbi:hypothetical protein [Coleofasciculus sp. H7-2]